METQRFNLAHILSITTMVLCPLAKNADYPMRTVREILKFMVNEPDGIWTQSLPRVADECRPYLLEQFPQLANVTNEQLTYGDIETNMEKLIAIYGDEFNVCPIHHEDHQIIDPQIELAMLAPHVEYISVDFNEDENDAH